MRRRNKSPKGSRPVSARGGRGGSRASAKVYAEVQRQTQTNSQYSSVSSRNNYTRRSATSAGKEKDNHNVISNPSVKLQASNSNGAAAEEAAAAIPSTSNDFYLHKKFKKVTTTTSTSTENSGMNSNCESEVNGIGLGDSSDVAEARNVRGDRVSESKMEIVVKAKNESDVRSASEANVNPQPASNAASSVSSNSSSVVYKPKFRISTEAEGTLSLSKETKEKEPSRIVREQRIDRQSLDDRISKIIDENQSILATWPEHLTKRLKNHTQSRPPHLQRTNQMVIMSGGSTTEIQPGSTKLHGPRLPGFDVPSEIGFVPTHSLLIRSNSDIMGQSLEQHSDVSDGSTTDLSFASCGSSSMVPKKRRRLSPTPSRLCGGEVSELPTNEAVSSKNYFQDVDMTVRVSNCGPSGAKVTIRTNNCSSSGGCLQSGVGAVNFSRLIEVPSSLSLTSSKNSLFYPEPFCKGRSLTKDDLPTAMNLKVTKTRGRPPRKAKITLESSSTTEPVVEFSLPTNSSEPSKLSVIVSPSKIVQPSKPSPSKDNPVVRVTEVVSKIEDSSLKPQLLLQSSTPNPKRPTFLSLKPANPALKKTESCVLPSPETPRGVKPYNQMSINGNAYTYLGFKVSTRSSYTCLFKPQPMFIPQETDPKLSMYSNWQPRPKDQQQTDMGISTNDPRVNGRKSPKSVYTTAMWGGCNTLTVSSPDKPISSPIDSSRSRGFGFGPRPLSSPSCSDASVPMALTVPSRASVSPGPSTSTSCTPLALVTNTNNSVRPSCLSPPSNSCGSNSNSNQSALLQAARTAPPAASSSESSADESSSSFGRSMFKSYQSKEKSDIYVEGPLSLTMNHNRNSVNGLPEENCATSSSLNSPVIMNRFDNPRVRIMEGGFESNEDYTYVRGRGRGRYVCEACGIRCKKPSMLRKHLKTHTDLRPYTCKLCNFSFKTKGNLTKHQKSKSHHKKCIGLGIHPNSSRSLAMIGPSFSISDTNTTDDNDSDDDYDDNGVDNDLDQDMDSDSQGEDGDGDGDAPSSLDNDNESESFEKEIAQSLLDLSKISRLPVGTPIADRKSQDDAQPQPIAFSVRSMLEEPISCINPKSSSATYALETPIDLSVKTKRIPDEVESEHKRLKIEKNGFVRSVGIVGEAQRWEPDEDIMLNGCLNLKKVRNTSSNVEETIFAVENAHHQTDVKSEVYEFPIENAERLEKDKLPLFSPRRKRDLSTSSSDTNGVVPPSESYQLPQPRPITPPSQNQIQKQQKLHQPWLSPPETKDNVREAEVLVPVPEQKIVEPYVDTPALSVPDEVDVATRDAVIVSSIEQSPEIPSPNTKVFSSLSGLKPQAEFRQPSGAQALVKDEGKAECNVCGKTFARASQLTLHMNIHYLERPFRCDPCGVSFRTKGHLIKHRRSSSHDCKVYLTEAWGVANEENPRPFKCPDCKIAFRIHGHLAKHLRSKMHIMRMECLGKLPFGIYFEMEKSGMNLNEIDTTDCDMSLVSLQNLARKIYGETWMERLTVPIEEPV